MKKSLIVVFAGLCFAGSSGSLLAKTPSDASPATEATASLVPFQLRCEGRENPLGVDVPSPNLAWQLQAGSPSLRGMRQSAYQVIVASTPERLAKNEGDLWDSGRVVSDAMNQIAFKGQPLASSQQVFWKVRVWDQADQPSAWSPPAQWTMGVLAPADWKAQWISAPGLVAPPATKTLGFHAKTSKQADTVKWVQVDLGEPQSFESVCLAPMLHDNKNGFGFPVHFKIEAALTAGFEDPTVLVDQTAADYPNPGAAPAIFAFPKVTFRFVRVSATKLWSRRNGDFIFALRQLAVMLGNANLALNAPVQASDSAEGFGWGQAGLTDGILTDGAGGNLPGSLLLRREFNVKPGLRRAVVHVTGLGQYEMSLNGAKVGSDLLSPGWTNYRKTVLYDTYDITAQLKPGANAAGIFLGNGMYSVRNIAGRYHKFTGSFGNQKAIAKIQLDYADGSTDFVITDPQWKVHSGPVLFSCIYGGEDYDARANQQGWNQAGFPDANWQSAAVVEGPGGGLKGTSVANPPIREFETLKPVAQREKRPGLTIYDMGQNASIMPRIKVKGPAGSVVRVTPGELLAGGQLTQSPGGGPSYWKYTLDGNGSETYFPRFFYRGSRYQQVEVTAPVGSSEQPVVESIASVVIQAASPVTGTFSCSNELFNRIWTLVRWAQRSNMVSVMTDCPHREKLGWLEEDYLNGPALRYNFDMAPLFNKVMNDMADAQLENGFVPNVAPEFKIFNGSEGNAFRNSPEWGSAFILVAWQQYLFHGDLELLRRHYEGMKRYMAYLGTKARGSILNYGLGDWYDIGPGAPGASKLTPKGLTATAIYFEDACVLAKTAKLLGKDEEAAQFEALAKEVRAAFNTKFFNADKGFYGTNSQTANSMPLVLDMVEPEHRASVLASLVKDVQERGLTAGDVGYRYLLRALADHGRSDVIYAMNNQSEKPGYGLQLQRGATSLTEAWDASAGSSQNHFMLGQINEWLFHDLAGIQCDPEGPGFKRILIKPATPGDLNSVKATYASASGMIESEWKRNGPAFQLRVVIPANTSATIFVPTDGKTAITESGTPVRSVPSVKTLGNENGVARFAVGSGTYHFQSNLDL